MEPLGHTGRQEPRGPPALTKGLKRSSRSRGRVMGHQASPEGARLLDYLTARRLIYLPCYRWVFDNALRDELVVLEEYAAK